MAARNVYIQLSRQLNALRTIISALELQDEDKVSNSRIESAKIRIDQIKEAIIILSVQAVVYFGCTLAFAAVAIAELMKPLAVESQYFTFFNLGAL